MTDAAVPGIATRNLAGQALPVVAVTACLFATGLAERRIFAIFPVDADLLDTVLLSRGIHRFGIGFVRSWGYTPDNWLFSLLAPELPVFSLLGTSATVVVGAGLAILLLTASAAAAVLWLACGQMRVALLVLCFLLVPNVDAIGRVGFLGYGVTHNITLFWGLLALGFAMACAGAARRAPALGWALASAAALAGAAISDPWADPAFVLPMILADAILLGSGAGRAAAVLLAAHLCAGLATATSCFGLIDFLQPSTMQLGDAGSVLRHASGALRSIARLWWPIPFVGPPRWDHRGDLAVSAGLDAAAFGVLALSALRLWRGRAMLSPQARLLAMTAVFSIAATILAFSAGSLPVQSTNGRFFLNLWAFAPILATLAIVRVGPPHARPAPSAAILAFGALIAAASLSEGVPEAVAPTSDVDTLAAFLLGRHLTYGYGTYWGTGANEVTWRSHWRVHLRPVVFNGATGRIGRRGGQTSPHWYAADDRPPGSANTFVILATDPENCAVMRICESGLMSQFGPPDRVLPFDAMRVWVWDRILPTISAEPN